MAIRISLLHTVQRSALGLTQPPIQWLLGGGAVFTEVKPLGHEADCSPPSSAEVKNGGVIPSLPHTRSWRGA
jgi:hypothetical protein